jgi:hypothetical protein
VVIKEGRTRLKKRNKAASEIGTNHVNIVDGKT